MFPQCKNGQVLTQTTGIEIFKCVDRPPQTKGDVTVVFLFTIVALFLIFATNKKESIDGK